MGDVPLRDVNLLMGEMSYVSLMISTRQRYVIFGSKVPAQKAVNVVMHTVNTN